MDPLFPIATDEIVDEAWADAVDAANRARRARGEGPIPVEMLADVHQVVGDVVRAVVRANAGVA